MSCIRNATSDWAAVPARADMPAAFQIADTARARFPHAVTRLRVIETHISWVLLTGPFAYKIKKPVN